MRLEIEKHVPVAGGMGGGSADAAAALVACDALWGTGLGRDDLVGLGSELGADVPFALVGGTAIGVGHGDRLSPVLATGTFEWVIAVADFGLSTPDVYEELDRTAAATCSTSRRRRSPRRSTPAFSRRSERATRSCSQSRCRTTCSRPRSHLAPDLVDLLVLGDTAEALAGIISGSGPTVAFLAADQDSAIGLQVALSASGLRVVARTGRSPARGSSRRVSRLSGPGLDVRPRIHV